MAAVAEKRATVLLPEGAMRPYDTALMAVVVALMGIGVVMVYSASIYTAQLTTGDGAHYLNRQLINVAVAVVALVIGMRSPYHRLRAIVYPLLLVSIGMLVLLMIPGIGTTAGRSTRWFRLPFFSFQPTELAKLAFIIWLAYSLEKKTARMRSFTVGFLPHLLVCCLIMALCLAQPDLGTCIVLGTTMVALLFVGGTRVGYIVAMGLVALPVLAKLLFMNTVRWKRIIAFLDPWAHRHEYGYQAVNSLAAMGSGGLSGMGLGASRQKIGYVPEAQTDFIFPILGEELGFIGAVIVIGMLIFVVCRGFRIAWMARDDFGRYLAFGITFLLGLQAAINLGVSLSLLPTKGLTLPFISFGGSALVITAFSVGILLNISRFNRSGEEPPAPVRLGQRRKPREPRARRAVTQQLPVVAKGAG